MADSGLIPMGRWRAEIVLNSDLALNARSCLGVTAGGYTCPQAPGASVPRRAFSVGFAFQREVSRSRLVWPGPLEGEERHSAELPEPHGPEDQRPQARQLGVWRRGRWAAGPSLHRPLGSWSPRLRPRVSFWSPPPTLCEGKLLSKMVLIKKKNFKNSLNLNLIHDYCFVDFYFMSLHTWKFPFALWTVSFQTFFYATVSVFYI